MMVCHAMLSMLDSEIVQPVYVAVVEDEINGGDDKFTSVDVNPLKRVRDQFTQDVIAHI